MRANFKKVMDDCFGEKYHFSNMERHTEQKMRLWRHTLVWQNENSDTTNIPKVFKVQMKQTDYTSVHAYTSRN